VKVSLMMGSQLDIRRRKRRRRRRRRKDPFSGYE
jgi:hypothetical protein